MFPFKFPHRAFVFFAFIVPFQFIANNYYWVGGTGNWSNYSQHWATSSGGLVFYTQAPSGGDNVIFDVNSFSAPGQSVTIDNFQTSCHDMIWANVNSGSIMKGSSTCSLLITGALQLTSQMDFEFLGETRFTSDYPGNIITSAGKIFKNHVYFDGVGGWILQDSLTLDNFSYLFLEKGSLNTGSNTVNCGNFISTSSNTRELDLGSSIFKVNVETDPLNGYGAGFNIFSNTNLNFICGTSTIIINISSNFQGLSWENIMFYGGLTFNDVIINHSANAINRDIKYIFYYPGTFHDLIVTAPGTLVLQQPLNIGMADFNTNLEIEKDCFFDTLKLESGKICTFFSGTIQTIGSQMEAIGNCSNFIKIQSKEPGLSATINKSAGSINTDYNILQDINVTGGAGFTADNVVDLGNNSGWTINQISAKNFYWIGGTGNWSDPAHWSDMSGGTSSGCLPSPSDNAIFDDNSFLTAVDSVYIDKPLVRCSTLQWNGTLATPLLILPLNNRLEVYGSFLVPAGMQLGFAGKTIFCSNQAGNTISAPGNVFGDIEFNGANGSWSLSDSLTCSSRSGIDLERGSLNTNSVKITCGSFVSSNFNTRSLSLGSSEIKIALTKQSSGWNLTVTNGLTFYGDSSYIHLIVGSSPYQFCSFEGDLSYNKVTLEKPFDPIFPFPYHYYINNGSFKELTIKGVGSGILGQYGPITIQKANFLGDVDILSSCNFDTLLVDAGRTISLQPTTTQTINNLIINGSCNSLVNFKTTISGNSAYIQKSSGTIIVDYLTLQDISAIGGATFVANNSLDIGNNTGFIINPLPPRNLFWVKGSGTWTDSSHWSLLSGGNGGECLPGISDTVYFDSNSFLTNTDTIIANGNIVIGTMNWVNANGSLMFSGNNQSSLDIYGSLFLSPNLINAYAGEINFKGSGDNFIRSSGQIFNNHIRFNGGGSWTLEDSLTLNTGSFIFLNQGTLNSNDQNIKAERFESTSGLSRTLNLGSSTVTLEGLGPWWSCSWTQNFNFNAGLSHIILKNTLGAGITFDGDLNYHDVTFDGSNQTTYNLYEGKSFNNLTFKGSGLAILHDTASIHYARFFSNVDVLNSCHFDTLEISNGQIINLAAADTQFVNNHLEASGTYQNPVSIYSTGSGTQAHILVNTDTVCLDHLNLRDINAISPAIYYAGNYSDDISNNSGWNFSSCVQAVSNVWPGDANRDSIVNYLDLLYLGLAFNETGFPRNNPSNDWMGQPATDWQTAFANLSNVKNADCDGNGVVNFDDTLAVNQNYLLVSQILPFPNEENVNSKNSLPPLFLQSISQPVSPGSLLEISLNFGTSSLPVSNGYGLAFQLNYDSNFIDSINFDLQNSWLIDNSSKLSIIKNFIANGISEICISRVDLQNISGDGLIGKLKLFLKPGIEGKLPISFNNIRAISNDESLIPVQGISDSIEIKTITGISEFDFRSLKLISNPVKENLELILPAEFVNNEASLSINEIYGRTLKTLENIASTDVNINCSELSPGFYFLTFHYKKGGKPLVVKFIKI